MPITINSDLAIAKNLASSDVLAVALETKYPKIGQILRAARLETLIMLQKEGCVEAWDAPCEFKYDNGCPGWGTACSDFRQYLMTTSGNDLRFAGVISTVASNIEREWCRIHPQWVSPENSPREANYAVSAKETQLLTNMTGDQFSFNGTMVFAVTGRVSATEWNYGSGKGYKVKYDAHLNLKAVWVDDDQMKILNNRLDNGASIETCVAWIKKTHGPAQIEDVQRKMIHVHCPF